MVVGDVLSRLHLLLGQLACIVAASRESREPIDTSDVTTRARNIQQTGRVPSSGALGMQATVSPKTENLVFGGFDSSRLLMSRGGIPRSAGNLLSY